MARLAHLNCDANDARRSGVASVEVYLATEWGAPAQRVGVLELYLPYAPISRDVTAGLNKLNLDLAAELAGSTS